MLDISDRQVDDRRKAAILNEGELVISERKEFPELTAVYRVCLQLQELSTPEKTARQVIRVLEETLGYEYGAVLLIDREAGLLRPFALSEQGYGLDPEAADNAYSTDNDIRLEIGVTGWVAQHGQSVCLGDVRKDPRYVLMIDGIRSELCVPMRVDDRVIGVINVESKQLNAFNERDQQVLETVANQVAMAIQNAQLFSRLQKYSTEQEKSILERTTDLERVVNRLRMEIGDRRRAEAILAEQNEELAELNAILIAQNEELNAFGHTVAHDLKNPLAILLGFSEVLCQDYGDSDDELLRQGVQVISENGARMANIIDELLLLAEVRQLEEIQLAPLNMDSILAEVKKQLVNLIDQRGANIYLPPRWPNALGHPAWVREVWVNYLGNAIKYGGQPPEVTLGANIASSGMAKFWVMDNGSGIAPHDQERLFTPFTQLDRVRVEGHGLGLSIVQRIVTKLGGEVGVESQSGQGSTFWFTLPVNQDR